MNLRKIKEIAVQKNITLKSIAEEINFTQQGLIMAIQRNDISCTKLENISKYLKVSPIVFFETTEREDIQTDKLDTIIELLSSIKDKL